jgi:hypothetical protein
MIDHVTIHVLPGTLDSHVWWSFFRLLGMEEVAPDDPYEHGYRVRWWAEFEDGDEPPRKPFVHLVETDDGERDSLALGHFCVSGINPSSIRLRAHRLGVLERDSGSGRMWLSFAGVRVEVRP